MGYIDGLGVGLDKVAVMTDAQRTDDRGCRCNSGRSFLCGRCILHRGRNCRCGRSGFDKGIVCIQSHGKCRIRLKRWVHGSRSLRLDTRLCRLCHVAPFEDGLSHGRRDEELGTPREQPRAVFGGGGLVVHGNVEDCGKLVVHVVALHGFQAHLLWHHPAVLVREHIILLGTHGADNMSGGGQNTLDKGVLTGRDLGPVGEGVPLQVGVEIQQIVPAMGDAVDDDDLGSCLFTDAYGLDVGFGGIVFEREDLITAQMGIKVGRAVLGIDDGDTRPVACHAVSDQEATNRSCPNLKLPPVQAASWLHGAWIVLIA